MQVVYVGVDSILSTILMPQWVIPDQIRPCDASITTNATVRKSVPVTGILLTLADCVHKSHTIVQKPTKTCRKPLLDVQKYQCSG